MEKYSEPIKEYLQKYAVGQIDADAQSLLEQLYKYYMEGNASKEPEARAYFVQFNELIACLELANNDDVCNLVCELCIFHERFAFMEGVRIGGKLAVEIMQ